MVASMSASTITCRTKLPKYLAQVRRDERLQVRQSARELGHRINLMSVPRLLIEFHIK